MLLGIIKGRAGVDLLSKKRKARFKQGLSKRLGKVLRGCAVFPFIIPYRTGCDKGNVSDLLNVHKAA